MLIQEVHVARNVPPGVRMAVGIRFLHAGVQKHSLVLDVVEQAPRIGLVAANEQGQFLPDEVVYFHEEELHQVFARTPIMFTRDSQGNMLLLSHGASEDDQWAIRVIDGVAQIAIGEADMQAERFTPLPDPETQLGKFRDNDWPGWEPTFN